MEKKASEEESKDLGSSLDYIATKFHGKSNSMTRISCGCISNSTVMFSKKILIPKPDLYGLGVNWCGELAYFLGYSKGQPG